MNPKTRIQNHLKLSVKAYQKMTDSCWQSIDQAAQVLVETYFKKGGTVFTCGNGGSAADAQHIADELMCMLRSNHNFEYRFPLSAHALTTDSSVITAIANDIGYDFVFSRQLEALAQTKDLLIGLSTSGNSLNVVKAFELTKSRGIKSIAFTGQSRDKSGGKIAKLADIVINIPATDVGIIQQGHVAAFHSMCDVMEQILFGK
ncbi:MAG: Phosphoheptose isomerase [Candidatus Beckwithbacteria bacterium GW2011_GWB1_47_15]|uniref:Phosphoheptose isomerase n=1 Tax=Candidatus Beckwithbacteria bacterium GW2011_GWB1_47_15 TaxID=1618371 RepID=A0A0G1UTE6_9BACT|nr:MAG: phosphoheptose isomerase, D-sedoheptulose 7-phosphate isomerase [Candidatus Beckwithbacteria bacterium GW2011_GWC1_49_16]KKU35741.1 MAG: Phosphoheptose isomerase [Candidatus Beckwithbacteria bacterium GW2011_GWA1_46_30]KKU60995.1 MAG: Phosphoheptose isomerase [Candidatus Beckwithbacteria bacterium GW2011_GWB1_47_15]KKU72300.1 MAG: Phosphoheptose isomerase [Candidatus Beckwithbacteria bacterium GW2011_GWA2_47_25]KKW04940.1 MAG: Phosphoheptose isomerase [Candidatus Beckwithbacteria bacter